MHRTRPDLPPEIAAVADLLAHVRARIILEAENEPPHRDPPAAPSAAQTSLPSTRLLLRVKEVAEALAVSRSAVYELIRSGEIPAMKIVARLPQAGADRAHISHPAHPHNLTIPA